MFDVTAIGPPQLVINGIVGGLVGIVVAFVLLVVASLKYIKETFVFKDDATWGQIVIACVKFTLYETSWSVVPKGLAYFAIGGFSVGIVGTFLVVGYVEVMLV